MKVLYDISMLGKGQYSPRHRGGVARVVARLARELMATGSCELIGTALPGVQQRSLDYLQSPGLADLRMPHSRSRRAIYRLLREINGRAGQVLPVCRRLDELGLLDYAMGALAPAVDRRSLAAADVYHSPFHPLPEEAKKAHGARRTAHGAPRPARFLTVHDLIPALFPQFCGARLRRLFQRILQSLDDESWVIANSQATKEDLCAFQGIAPERVFVTHWAADRDTFYPCRDAARIRVTRERYGIPEAPYLLSLSTLEPRKNIEHVIRCFARLVEQERVPDLQLVLVGARGWDEERIFAEIAAHPATKERVRVTGHVPDADLAPLYSGALAFLCMSLYEGFGLPALEAMQCGVPVVASNTSSLPEVVGGAGVLLSPNDGDGLCESLRRLYTGATSREELARKSLERAKRFSWERCAEETIAAYRAALSEQRVPSATSLAP